MMLALLNAAVLVPSLASANIRVEPRLEDPISGIIILIVTNFPIDLLLIAAAMLVVLVVMGRKTGDMVENSYDFVISVMMASAFVAIAGGVVDFVVLYERVEDHYLLKDLTASVILPAVGLILVTIALFVHAFVGVRLDVSFVMGGVIAPISAVGWWLNSLALGSTMYMCSAIAIGTCAVFAFVLLGQLRRIHERALSGERDKAYEGA
jgi:hypothetical protein